jgi:hypothetical protein
MIKYKDLSWPLKYAVVSAWIVGTLWVGTFLYGFMIGLTM